MSGEHDNELQLLRHIQAGLKTWLNEPSTVITDVAKASGVSASALHKFRKGTRRGNLSVATMERLLKVKVIAPPRRRRGKVPGPERGVNVRERTDAGPAE